MYDFLKDVINDKNLKTPITLITTGGQTGVDEAGAKAGMRLGIPTKVVAPKGWTFRSIENKDISNEQAFKDRFNIQSEITQQQLSTASAESIVDSLNDEIAAGTEEILSDREKKIIKDRDAFLNSDIISPTERVSS